MKLVSLHLIICSSLLVLWTSHSETEANSPDVCQDDLSFNNIFTDSSLEYDVERKAVVDNFHCLLYPKYIINCSWSFINLQDESLVFVRRSVCVNETLQSQYFSAEERTGSRCLNLTNVSETFIILQINITLKDAWTVYTTAYEMDMIEILPPPQNISASVKDGRLLVTWDLPQSLGQNPSCFEYQLDLGDQERPKTPSSEQSYSEPNADPSRVYRVRIRTRKRNECQRNAPWSDWSHTVTVEQSLYKLNVLVIIAISLGVPMILLAVLLLVCHQRVSRVLFPPIPCPPPKYKFFLEKNDTFNVLYPPLSAEPEAEITEVEDTEQKPGKTF